MKRKCEIGINRIMIQYSFDRYDYDNVINEIETKGYFSINRTFFITKNNIDHYDDYDMYVTIANSYDENYYVLDKEVFNIEKSFFISKKIKKIEESFFHIYNTSIVKKVLLCIDEDFYLESDDYVEDNHDHIKVSEYASLIKSFPTIREKDLYVDKTVSNMLAEYFEIVDYDSKYNKYIEKHRKYVAKFDDSYDDLDFKLLQYKQLLDRLKDVIEDETSTEEQCQKIIINILLILFPKYLMCQEKVYIKSLDGSDKILDYMLIDANGYIDIVEIKKPNVAGPLSAHSYYRNNYYPLRELSGCVTQVEKYLYLLSSNKVKNEEKINEKYKDQLCGIEVKINNPQGIIIYGRSNEMNEEQKRDFEIIKRNYKNVVDIITYDDLLDRLNNTIRYIENELKKKGDKNEY